MQTDKVIASAIVTTHWDISDQTTSCGSTIIFTPVMIKRGTKIVGQFIIALHSNILNKILTYYGTLSLKCISNAQNNYEVKPALRLFSILFLPGFGFFLSNLIVETSPRTKCDDMPFWGRYFKTTDSSCTEN